MPLVFNLVLPIGEASISLIATPLTAIMKDQVNVDCVYTVWCEVKHKFILSLLEYVIIGIW